MDKLTRKGVENGNTKCDVLNEKLKKRAPQIAFWHRKKNVNMSKYFIIMKHNWYLCSHFSTWCRLHRCLATPWDARLLKSTFFVHLFFYKLLLACRLSTIWFFFTNIPISCHFDIFTAPSFCPMNSLYYAPLPPLLVMIIIPCILTRSAVTLFLISLCQWCPG